MVLQCIEVCSLVVIVFGYSIAWISLILYTNSLIMADKPVFKNYSVTVTYDLPNALTSQFNMSVVESSVTFLAKTSTTLNNRALIEAAKALVKERDGKGLAKNFRVTGFPTEVAPNFFAKGESPVVVDFSAKPADEKPEEEQ